MLIDSTFFVQTTCSQNIPSQLYLYDYCNCISMTITSVFVKSVFDFLPHSYMLIDSFLVQTIHKTSHHNCMCMIIAIVFVVLPLQLYLYDYRNGI